MPWEEVLSLSPGESAAIALAWEQKERRAWLRTGLVCATIANGLTPRKDKRPWKAADFVGRGREERENPGGRLESDARKLAETVAKIKAAQEKENDASG